MDRAAPNFFFLLDDKEKHTVWICSAFARPTEFSREDKEVLVAGLIRGFDHRLSRGIDNVRCPGARFKNPTGTSIFRQNLNQFKV